MLMNIELEPWEVTWNNLDAYITKMCRSVARAFPKVEEDDLRQEVCTFLWQKQEHLYEASEPYIKTCIKNVVYNSALKTRDTVLQETDQFWYHDYEVKELLPYYMTDTMENAPVPPGITSLAGNDLQDIKADFDVAFDAVSESVQAILIRRYRIDEELSEARDRKALSRAHQKFLALLNKNMNIKAREYDSTGSRKVMTIAQSQFTVKEAA